MDLVFSVLKKRFLSCFLFIIVQANEKVIWHRCFQYNRKDQECNRGKMCTVARRKKMENTLNLYCIKEYLIPTNIVLYVLEINIIIS